MAYRNDCHFLEVVEDDGNPASGPEIIEVESDTQNNTNGQSESQGFASAQSWVRDRQMPTSHDGDTNDMSGSPGGQSAAGPTPNSSTTSEQLKGPMGNRMNGSGRTSYDASPAPAHQAVTSQAGVEPVQGSFYSGSGGFGVTDPGVVAPGQQYPIPIQQPSMRFEMANEWGEMQAAAQPPVAEGVLRSLMNMGPMDAMDVSVWDSGN